MKNNRLIIILTILSLFQIGCEEDAKVQVLPESENGNFTLYVSNQSYAIDTIDIQIYIDDMLAVNEDFEVKNQHNWKRFRFDLSKEEHVIVAKSTKGAAMLEQEFSITDSAHWAVIDYWYYPDNSGGTDPTPRQFSFNIKNSPISFQ